jgi:hypothetical protein
MPSSSAPRRGHASVAFGSEAEVLPAGSADQPHYSLPGRQPTNACRRRVSRRRIDQPDTHREVEMVAGVLASGSRCSACWVGMSATPAMTRQNARSGAPISSRPEPMGSWKTMSQTLALGRNRASPRRPPPLPLRTKSERVSSNAGDVRFPRDGRLVAWALEVSQGTGFPRDIAAVMRYPRSAAAGRQRGPVPSSPTHSLR